MILGGWSKKKQIKPTKRGIYGDYGVFGCVWELKVTVKAMVFMSLGEIHVKRPNGHRPAGASTAIVRWGHRPRFFGRSLYPQGKWMKLQLPLQFGWDAYMDA